MYRRCSLWILAALLMVSLGSLSGLAQVITGTIYGTVIDESKGALPGSTVTVRNVDTGVTRTLVTDGEGRFRASNLSLGKYEVEAALPGFATGRREGIELTVGAEARTDFTLGVGTLSEDIQVTGQGALVDTTKSQLADLVDQKQIQNLPLNNRSYTDLALLEPGVMTTSRNASYSGTSGGGIRLAISGARPTNTGFYVDGMDTKDAFGRTPGSAAGTTLGVDTIREFQVLVSNFSAQYGGSGGVINAVTKSGGNVMHGSGFWFLRSSALDAANYFDTLGVPPFRRDQAGFTLSGPIKKDRTFFFVSYEKLRERRTTTTTINVPGADLRKGITPTGTVVVDPLSAKFMAAMPLPNGLIASNGIGEFKTQTASRADEDYIMGKVDQQIGQADSLFVRFTSDIASNVTPLAFPGFAVPADTKGRFMISEYNRIISSSTLNTVRFSYNRSDAVLSNTSEGYSPEISLIPGRVAPQLVVPGLASFGNRGFDDRAWYLTSMQASERFSLTKGKHSFVGGFDWLGSTLQGFSASRLHGRVQFSSLNNFLLGRPQTWEYLVPGTGSDPAPGEKGRTFHQNQFTFYGQDDFKPHPNLTLNLGLRWEFVDTPTEKDGKISNLRNPTDRAETVGDPFFNPQKGNFGPRVGAAWDPSGDGKMSIRGGFGMFYQPLNYATWQIAAVQGGPFFIRTAVDQPSWPPTVVTDLTKLPPTNPTPITFNPETPYYQHFNGTFQRELPGSMVASASYAGSRGRHLASTQNGNPYVFTTLADGTKFWAAGALPRVNTAFGATEIRAFDLLSNYHSLQVRINKRFGNGLQLQSAYTFSKNEDNGSETQGTALMDPSEPLLDYGPSDWDTRHSWSFNYIYQFPFFDQREGMTHAILSGWQVSGLVTAVRGTPRNVIEGFNHSRDGNVLSASQTNDRPNLAPGADPNPILSDGRDPLKYADVSSYVLQPAGTHGTLGRNVLIGPGILQFDASFVKNIPFGTDRRVELRAEFFNLLNRANFGNPTVTAFTSATGPNPTFGRINSTSGSARQGQLALKVVF